MKLLLSILAFLAFALIAGVAFAAPERRKTNRPPFGGLDPEAMLDAIAHVESGNRPHAISVRGERGRCQFIASTWYQYTNRSFDVWAASGAPFIAQVERAHLQAIVDGLDRLWLAPSPSLVGAAWRHGVSGAADHWADDRSERIGNLYREFLAARK